MFEPLLHAADASLARVVAARTTDRSVAHELLAADAFVTWAFEAASHEPASLAARADQAMRRISAVAAPHLEAR